MNTPKIYSDLLKNLNNSIYKDELDYKGLHNYIRSLVGNNFLGMEFKINFDNEKIYQILLTLDCKDDGIYNAEIVYCFSNFTISDIKKLENVVTNDSFEDIFKELPEELAETLGINECEELLEHSCKLDSLSFFEILKDIEDNYKNLDINVTRWKNKCEIFSSINITNKNYTNEKVEFEDNVISLETIESKLHMIEEIEKIAHVKKGSILMNFTNLQNFLKWIN